MALTAAMRECKFFPTVAELWEHIPPLPPASDGTLAEMAELKKREAAGERFYGEADLAKAVRDVLEKRTMDKPKTMPNVKTVWPDFDPNKNKATLDAQAAELLKGKA